MKIAGFILLALVATTQATMLTSTFPEFQKWTQEHNKEYSSPEEMAERYEAWQQSVGRINAKNIQHMAEGAKPAVFGLNKFSDLTPAQFKAQYLKFEPAEAHRETRRKLAVHRPYVSVEADSVDWVAKGAVTPVKDQAQCGSCWAFSVTEEVESMNFIYGPEQLKELSVQQVVSCDTTDSGCNGGDPINAYGYIISAGGIQSEESYPYTSGGGDSGTCEFDASQIVEGMANYSYATPGCYDSCDSQDEDLLASNLASVGPASICVNAEPWQDYTGGVMSSGCSHGYGDLDHCVQLTGYTKGGADGDYWIVRNSWNTNWGESGFIYLEMGNNLCGVADEATFVFPSDSQ